MANLEIVYHLIGECNEHMEIVEATREHLRNKPNYGYIDYYQSFDDALEAGKKLIADKKAELMSELAMLDAIDLEKSRPARPGFRKCRGDCGQDVPIGTNFATIASRSDTGDME